MAASIIAPHLLYVLLHANPLFITDLDTAIPPFIVIAPLFGIAENLFRILRYKQTVKALPLLAQD